MHLNFLSSKKLSILSGEQDYGTSLWRSIAALTQRSLQLVNNLLYLIALRNAYYLQLLLEPP